MPNTDNFCYYATSSVRFCLGVGRGGEGRGGEGMEIPQLVWESKNEEGKVMAGLYGYFLFYPFLLKINILPSIS